MCWMSTSRIERFNARNTHLPFLVLISVVIGTHDGPKKCVVPLCLHVPFLVLIVVRTHDGPKKCVVPLCLYTIFGSDTVVLVIRTHDGPKKCEAFRYVYTSFLVLIQ